MIGSRSPAAAELGRRGSPKPRVRRLVAVVAVAFGLQLALSVAAAPAHNWDGWHWNKGGSYVPMYIWDQTGGCGTWGNATNNALWDIHNNPHPIYVYCVGYHTDVSLWEANEPGAWFCGLAEVSGVYTSVAGQLHITHGHARTNTACTSGSGLSGTLFKQGVHCQEVMHTFGFDHADTGDCMGLSYFSGSNGRYYVGNTGAYVWDWDHQSADIYWRYRYHSPHS